MSSDSEDNAGSSDDDDHDDEDYDDGTVRVVVSANEMELNNTTTRISFANNPDEWATKDLALAQIELRNAQLKKLQDVQTIEYLKAQNIMLTTIASQRKGVVMEEDSTAVLTSLPLQQQNQQQAPASPQQERSRRARHNGLLEYRSFRGATQPQDVTFHATEEMLHRSRKRIHEELTLSRMRAADALGSKSRYLEQRMMDSHANSSKRYSELHSLYTEAVDLRDRYSLSVQVPRPVMSSGNEYAHAKARLMTGSNRNDDNAFDLSSASDQELERYRSWLRAKNEKTTRATQGPTIY